MATKPGIKPLGPIKTTSYMPFSKPRMAVIFWLAILTPVLAAKKPK
jgi:hypothetical protein